MCLEIAQKLSMRKNKDDFDLWIVESYSYREEE